MFSQKNEKKSTSSLSFGCNLCCQNDNNNNNQKNAIVLSPMSKFFVLPSISSYYKKDGFKSTKMIGMIYIRHSKPSIDLIRKNVIDKRIQIPNFRYVYISRDRWNCCCCSKQHQYKKKDMWDYMKLLLNNRNALCYPQNIKDIDISYHFQVIDGKGRFAADTEEEDGCSDDDSESYLLSDIISEIHMTDWDITKPLWKIFLIRNMKCGRSLLLCVVDHAIGDGSSMLRVIKSLLDKNNNDIIEQRQKIPKTASSSLTTTTNHINDNCRQQQKQNQKLRKNFRLSHRIVSFLWGCYYGLFGIHIDGILFSDDDNGLKVPSDKKYTKPPPPPLRTKKGHGRVGGRRGGKDCEQTKHFDLNDFKDMKNKLGHGTTVNDILFAIITIAIQQYFVITNDKILDKVQCGKTKLHINFAVDTNFANRRRTRQPPRNNKIEDMTIPTISNDVAAPCTILPIRMRNNHFGYRSKEKGKFNSDDEEKEDSRNLLDIVWKCKALMDEFKISPIIYLSQIIQKLVLRLCPDVLIKEAALSTLMKSTCCMSNVIGPSSSLPITICNGLYQIDDLSFIGTAHKQGLYIGIISFNERIRISICLDKENGNTTTYDPPRNKAKLLKSCIEDAFDRLRTIIVLSNNDNFIQQELLLQPPPPERTLLAAKILEWLFPIVLLVVLGVILSFGRM